MKALVAIASYGVRNDGYLHQLVNEYKSMSFDVDIVVLSNIRKDVAAGVEVVVVALKGKDPWSLPFPHKQIFADRLNDYDLFVYSEDDTLLRETNIRAFLKVSAVLPETEVPGFLRFERAPDGLRNYPEIHGRFHWDPQSVRNRGGYQFAAFTNEHAACYVLSQSQLRRAILSGGFLVEPHQGKYDLLCSAATDPYTQCGLQKLICISHIDDFLIHHLPNKYCGTSFGVNEAEFNRQLKILIGMPQNGSVPKSLFDTETKLMAGLFSKDYYEPVKQALLSSIPAGARRVLSLGCGSGAMEARLSEQGLRVAAIPLDPIIPGAAASAGVEIIQSDFSAAQESLIGERFDCLLLSNILHLVADPVKLLSDFSSLLASDSSVAIMSVPNIRRLRAQWGMICRDQRFKGLGRHEDCGVHCTSPKVIRTWIQSAGMSVQTMLTLYSQRWHAIDSIPLGSIHDLLASEFVAVAKGAMLRG